MAYQFVSSSFLPTTITCERNDVSNLLCKSKIVSTNTSKELTNCFLSVFPDVLFQSERGVSMRQQLDSGDK